MALSRVFSETMSKILRPCNPGQGSIKVIESGTEIDWVWFPISLHNNHNTICNVHIVNG